MRRAVDPSTRFVYITNPNNPTGHYIDRSTMVGFCREVGAKYPLIVDEAYIEFIQGDETPSLVPLLREVPHMIVTRTFSKIHGLAGMRIGYALARAEWVKDWETWDQGGGIGISNVSAMAALAALKDRSFVSTSRKRIETTRNRFVGVLKDLGIKVYPSRVNFVLVETRAFEKRLIPLLEREKIDIVIGRTGPMQGLARISIGTDEEMNLLLNKIKSVML